MKISKPLRLSWVLVSIISAFMLGLYFRPGTAQRMPPRLTPQMMQQRMPQRAMPTQRMMPPAGYQAPVQRTR